MGEIIIEIEGEKKKYEFGMTYEQIIQEYQGKYENQIALVSENGKLRELYRKAKDGAEVKFVTLSSSDGHKTYERSAILLTMKALDDVLEHDKSKQFKVEFAIGNGLFIRPLFDMDIDDDFIGKLKARMRDLVSEALPVTKTSYPTADARELFEQNGMTDKSRLFKFRRGSSVNIYDLDGYKDYFYGYMLPNSGFVKYFDIEKYENGFMLILPAASTPTTVDSFEPRKNLFSSLDTATEWGQKLHISTVGDLNEKICSGVMDSVILVQEALQERRIAEIASDIVKRGGVKFVMIAGPSSSGKTTFSHRLSVQLSSFGLTPHPIAVDDYFKNRKDTPKDADGNYNFECLEAIDVELFNSDMLKLLEGEAVELPTFNFVTGEREYKGNIKQLGPDDILVIEGIHGLNDKMSYALPVSSKYKIYISALTSLNIDEHNRIPTTDNRLLRRLVRDARTRGASAQRTIGMWPSVRRGEEENIFPFQDDADAVFNSVLIYELAVIKQFAEPLLFNVGQNEPEYYEAKRLLKFLEYFVGVDTASVPNNSLLREFVGGSCFSV